MRYIASNVHIQMVAIVTSTRTLTSWGRYHPVVTMATHEACRLRTSSLAGRIVWRALTTHWRMSVQHPWTCDISVSNILNVCQCHGSCDLTWVPLSMPSISSNCCWNFNGASCLILIGWIGAYAKQPSIINLHKMLCLSMHECKCTHTYKHTDTTVKSVTQGTWT